MKNAVESYNEALTAAKAGRFNEAADLLRAAISEDPSHVNSHNVLGKVLIRTGAIPEARDCWKRALTLDPANQTARACLQSLRKKRLNRVLRSAAWGSGIVAVFVVLLSTNWQIRGIRAELSELVALLHEQLLSSDDSTRVAPPAAASALIAPARVPSDRTPERIPVRSVAPTMPTPSWKEEVRTTYEGALRSYQSRKFTRAIAAFREVLNVPHPHALKDNARYWIGECWYGMGKYEQALTAFEKVSTLYPKGNKVLHARIKIAYCHYRLGETAEARQCLIRLQHKVIGDPDADRAIRRLLRWLGP
ncbi:MAG: tetratricopeptide repeat protein [Candidatus Latescibacteria bacterium]|nr:tetratricopeptide repeat protein [Candidatus Latescibacterota bacterium]